MRTDIKQPKWNNTVDSHPEREDIIDMILDGCSYREISEKHGVSQSALSRYARRELGEALRRINTTREIKEGEYVFDQLATALRRVNKMYDACDRWLRDPENEDQYALDPRAHEVNVVYTVREGDSDVRRRETLQSLIDRVESSGKVSIEQLKTDAEDPRRLLLSTANTLNKQIELLARLQGQLKDMTINIVNSPVWQQVQQVVLSATEHHPDVRRELAAAFRALSESGGSTDSG